MNANFYAKNSSGNSANSGLDWANAMDTLANAATKSGVGDNLWLSSTHAETFAGALTVNFPGTMAAPSRVQSVNDAVAPPTTSANGATLTATSNVLFNGSAYIANLTIRPGQGGSVTQSFISGASANCVQVYDNCSIQLLTTGTGLAKIGFGDESRSDSCRSEFRNGTLKFGGVNQRVKIGCTFRMFNSSFLAGGAVPVNIFETGLRGISDMAVVGCDFSANIGTAFNLIIQNVSGNSVYPRFHALKLPAGWTGRIWSAKPTASGIGAYLTDSMIGTTRVRYWYEGYEGDARDETAIYRTGGFIDDVDGAAVSMKLVSTASTAYPAVGLRGAPASAYADTAGSAITKYVDVVHDSQGTGTAGALTNADIGLELIGPNGAALAFKTDFVAVASDHPASTEAWVGTSGMTAPIKQRLAVTFTPPRKGFYQLQPVLFVPSKTVYYCLKAS